ncbi:MAG: aminopeptidase [Candidatus Aenigmarchaeota archaeon]|nr:aminopeptidase [Candidatus Aenigmarchaeota archaeon]
MELDKILQRTFGIKRKERVLIVTDRRKKAVAEKFFRASKKLSDNVDIIVKPVAKQSAEEPPKYVAKEMKKSDVIMVIQSVSSMSHTKARREASKAGARIATMPEFNQRLMKALEADPVKMSKVGEKIRKIFKRTDMVRIKTKSGTDVTFSIKKRLIDVDEGLYNKPGKIGNFGNLPAGEVCLAPVEGTANGIVVIDSLKDLKTVYAKPKTKVVVRNGKAVDISDNRCKLGRIFKTVRNATNIAEFGIGINPKAKVIGQILQDEKAKGTCHIAFGNNKSFGGSVQSKIHLDAILFKPNIWFDGKVFMKNGKIIF